MVLRSCFLRFGTALVWGTAKHRALCPTRLSLVASLRALPVTSFGDVLVALVFLFHTALLHDSVCSCVLPCIGYLLKCTLSLLRFLSFLE